MVTKTTAAAVVPGSSGSTRSVTVEFECPFCQYRVGASDEYILLLHIESQHTEDSPFITKDERSNNITGVSTSASSSGHSYYCGSEISSVAVVNGAPPSKFNPLDYELGPSVSLDANSEDEGNTYVICPEDGCEEPILLLELQNHMDFHSAEHFSMALITAGPSASASANSNNGSGSPRRTHSNASSSGTESRSRKSQRTNHHEEKGSGKRREGKVAFMDHPHPPTNISPAAAVKRSWLEKAALAVVATVEGPVRRLPSESKKHPRPTANSDRRSHPNGVKKLGKSDLGPYAHEKQMPDWLRTQLEKGARVITVRKIDAATGLLVNTSQITNETPDLIPTIALLSERDPHVFRSWVCHPGVKHVGKQIAKEGGFCGYRNIQMMISFIQAAYPRGSHPFEGRIPTILKIQDIIEEGWDKGINASARLETGGIKGTRKYIGTSEAQTLLISTNIPSKARAFTKSDGYVTQHELLNYVETYFASGSDSQTKATQTSRPPIYFQHSGHSMTIVGLEKLVDGSSNLLVFDPFFTPSEAMKNLGGRRQLSSSITNPAMLLKVYRRNLLGYLHKYREFELIMLVTPESYTATVTSCERNRADSNRRLEW